MKTATIAVFALLAVATQALLDGERVPQEALCKGNDMTGVGNKPEKDYPGFGGCYIKGDIKIFPKDLIDKFDKDPSNVQLDFDSTSCGQAAFGGLPGTPALTVAPKLVQHHITPKTQKTKMEVVKEDGSKTYVDPPRGASCYEHRLDVKNAHYPKGIKSSLCTLFVPKGKYPGLACHHLMVQKHRPEGFVPHKHRNDMKFMVEQAGQEPTSEMKANACQCSWGVTIVEFEKATTGKDPVPLRRLHCGFPGLHKGQAFESLGHLAPVPWGPAQKKKTHQLYCQNWHRLMHSTDYGDGLKQLD